MYNRVIPRDLFNEAKLLKCIGRLCLLIHDGIIKNLDFELMENEFKIKQDSSSGELYVSTLSFGFFGDYITFQTEYNSKDNYPLYCTYRGTDYLVFDEKGNLTKKFREMLKG